jgi:hypothetical protein
MKKIAMITVALMMTAPVTFALPAAADSKLFSHYGGS